MRFLLIDRLRELEPGRRAVASKTFDAGEEFLRDHFPGAPLVPGVLLTEAMGQTAGFMLLAGSGFTTWPLLVMVERAKFRRLVRPGEELRLEAVLESSQPRDHAVRTSARVDGVLAAEARLFFHSFPPEELGAAGEWARSTFRALGGEALLAPGGPA